MTLFQALTGGAFDRLNCNIAGNLTKIFQKSQMPGGLPGGSMGGFGIDRYISLNANYFMFTSGCLLLFTFSFTFMAQKFYFTILQ